MTEPLEPPDADPADLAASDALDGSVVSPHDAIDDPAVGARLEEFRGVRAALTAGIVVPSPEVRDAQIAAAVSAFPSPLGESAGEVEPALAPAVPLGSRRQARPGRTRTRWLAVAAAVAAIALAVPLINAATHRSSSTDLTAAPGNEAAASTTLMATNSGAGAGPSTAPPATAGGPTGGPSTTAAPLPPGPVGPDDVGTAASPEELASLVLAAEPQLLAAAGPTTTVAGPGVTTTLPPATPEADDCDGAVRASTPGLGPLVVATGATFQGVRVDVLVYAVTTGGTTSYRLEAVDPASCAVVVERVL